MIEVSCRFAGMLVLLDSTMVCFSKLSSCLPCYRAQIGCRLLCRAATLDWTRFTSTQGMHCQLLTEHVFG